MRRYVKMATVAEALEKSPSGFFPAVPFDKSIAPDGVPSFCAGATIRSRRKGRLSVGLCAAAEGYALDAAPCLATTKWMGADWVLPLGRLATGLVWPDS